MNESSARSETAEDGRSRTSPRDGLDREEVVQRDGPQCDFFPQALLAGFSFRTGEHKAIAVRNIAAKPGKVPILRKNVPGNMLQKPARVDF